MIRVLLLLGLFAGMTALAQPQAQPMPEHRHEPGDAGGMVMNANTDTLPRGCSAISRDYEFAVAAGRRYAEGIPGMIFGMSDHELRVQPCSRISVTLVNEDAVRHQWMVHGLPVYLYPQGMFHIEANAGRSRRGTFIAPADDRTHLVHCGMPQHMENGMKGQLVVGEGSGDLWSVKEVGGSFTRSAYLPSGYPWLLLPALLLGAGLAFMSRRSD